VFLEAFAKLVPEAAGVDINARLLRIARTYVPGARFMEAPAESLPFADKRFDLVFLGYVLHETDDPVKALEEARRVAVRRVVVLEWPYRQEEQGPPLEHRLRPEVIEELAGRAGYGALERISLTHMVLYQLTPERRRSDNIRIGVNAVMPVGPDRQRKI